MQHTESVKHLVPCEGKNESIVDCATQQLVYIPRDALSSSLIVSSRIH